MEEDDKPIIEPLEPKKKPRKKYTVSEKVVDRNKKGGKVSNENRIMHKQAYEALTLAKAIVKGDVKSFGDASPKGGEPILSKTSSRSIDEEKPTPKIIPIQEVVPEKEIQKRPCRRERFHI
jgi:hypothetical protein